MADLKVNIAGVDFKNPIITASGTYGFGQEYNELFDISKLGGISCKGLTLEPRIGNPPPRIAETPAGILNSVGLQNPGVRSFVSDSLPWLKQKDLVVIANVAGSTYEDYIEAVEIVSDSDTDMIELNISCPNVKEGGVAFGVSCLSVELITKAVRNACKKPLIVKLSPNVSNIGDIALAAQEAGADAISLINTLTGMIIDIDNKRPLLKNNTGGLSGPAVFPIALRMVWEVASRVSVPVIGMGGISTWKDAVQMFLAGASAIQIGTANFIDAFAPLKILEGLEEYLDKKGHKDIGEIIGKVEAW
ncbi:MAG TPA: dihydroorotate dehydrogenase [Clostridiales bacterium]|jgi:dihydroorotate dehydrogenase (NAD+) catalytic subunit|nr:dihydroorotate dehydrogenase [Clostridiales bacterium]